MLDKADEKFYFYLLRTLGVKGISVHFLDLYQARTERGLGDKVIGVPSVGGWLPVTENHCPAVILLCWVEKCFNLKALECKVLGWDEEGGGRRERRI